MPEQQSRPWSSTFMLSRLEWWGMTTLLFAVWVAFAAAMGYWVGWIARDLEDEWRRRRDR